MRSGPCRSITDQFLATFEAARRRVLSSCSGSWHWIHSTQTESMLYENILSQMQDVLNGWSHCLHCSKLSLWYHRHQKCSNYFDFWVFFRWTCMDCKHGWMQTILQCSSRSEVFFLPFGTPSLSRPWNWRNSLDQGQGFGRLNGLRWYLTEVPRVVASRCCESESNGTWHFFFGLHLLESKWHMELVCWPRLELFSLFFWGGEGGAVWGIRWANVPHYSGGFLHCCSDHLVWISQSSSLPSLRSLMADACFRWMLKPFLSWALSFLGSLIEAKKVGFVWDFWVSRWGDPTQIQLH